MKNLYFMKMDNFIIFLLCASIGALIVMCLVGFFGIDGTIDQKSIYGELQGVEIEYRNQKIMTPFVLNINKTRERRIGGFETTDIHFPYAWIVLNKENPDSKIYMVPGDANIHVSCVDIEEFLKKNTVVAAVLDFLRGQCYENRE